MALTPEQVREQGKPSPERIRELEAYIDSNLVAMAKSGYWHGISAANYTRAECAWIISTYSALGWGVRMYDDQRDGSYISFEPQ